MQVSATSAATLQILDGTTVIWQTDLPAGAWEPDNDIDMRATAGNNLTIGFTATAGTQSVNAQGDFVPVGYPLFQS
jgi:hypothetical protein